MSDILKKVTPVADVAEMMAKAGEFETLIIDGLNYNNTDDANTTHGYAVVSDEAELADVKSWFVKDAMLPSKEPLSYDGALKLNPGEMLYVIVGNNSTSVQITKQ